MLNVPTTCIVEPLVQQDRADQHGDHGHQKFNGDRLCRADFCDKSKNIERSSRRSSRHEVRVLGPGEAYFFESRIPHRFRNTGKKRCIVVAAATPPSF
jgi:Cupin domain